MPRYDTSACPKCSQLVWVVLPTSDAPSPASPPAPEVSEPLPPAAEPAPCGRCRLRLSQAPQECSICLEELKDPVCYVVVANESWENRRCQHRFCRGCLRMHIRSRLDDGAWNVRCPGERCHYLLIEADLRKVFSAGEKAPDGDEVMQRYQALRSQGHGDHLRRVLRHVATRAAAAPGPEVTAAETAALGEATVEDGPAGSTASAAELQRALPEQRLEERGELSPSEGEEAPTTSVRELGEALDENFEDWAAGACQACPVCLVIVRKETGCDHIRCRCGTSFCYGCGAPYGGSQCICGVAASHGARLAQWLLLKGKLALEC